MVRWSQLPSRVGETWRHVVQVCASHPGALIHAALTRGVVRAVIPGAGAASLARTLQADRAAASGEGLAALVRIAERLPERVWPTEASSPVSDDLSHRVRRAFDPAHVLNPGLLGERTDRE